MTCRFFKILLSGICTTCKRDSGQSIASLLTRLRRAETSLAQVHRICSACSNSVPGEEIHCWSFDCPWLFERKRVENKVALSHDLPVLIEELGNSIEEQ